MDLSAMYAESGRLLGDPNNERWVVATLKTRLNLAMTVVQALTNAVKTLETLTPVAGTEEVQLDTDVIDVVRVHIKNSSGEWFPLSGILKDQLDFEAPNWQQMEDGMPRRFSWDGTNQKLLLIPAPSSEWAVSNGLRVWEIQRPVDLSATTDVPFSTNTAFIPYHMSLVHWTVAQCWMDDGTDEALKKSRFHRSDDFSRPGKFEMEVKKIWNKFDAPEAIPARILWRPQGGRASGIGTRSKANPLA
jgi:hypothetical protein